MNKIKFKDILTVKNGSTPSTKRKDFYDGKIVWITPKDLSNFQSKYIKEGSKSITQLGYDSCSTTLMPKGSILLSSRAPIGLLAIADNELCTNQGFKNLILNKDIVFNEYLFYWLKTRISYISSLGTGTTFKEVSKTVIENLEIKLPNLSTQKQIAKILSDLDAKIEVNNKINQELEAMAKTLYDYWFVQFDFPDKNGKPYKSSGGLMLFNEELKREIPEGWEVNKLGEILKTELGGTPSTKVREYWKGGIPWLNSGELANFPIISSEEKVTKEAISNSATSLMSKRSCVLSITRHLRPSILAIDACANQSVVGILESDKLKSSFIYPYLVNEIPRLMKLRTGAQQPHINKKTVDTSLIVNPAIDVLNNYYEIANPIYDQIINNSFQNQKLSELRDWLLPMLMNGQVSVGGDTKEKESFGLVAEGGVKYGKG